MEIYDDSSKLKGGAMEVFDWNPHNVRYCHNVVDDDDEEEEMTCAMESLYFDFSFLDDDKNEVDDDYVIIHDEIQQPRTKKNHDMDEISTGKQSTSSCTGTTCPETSQQSMALRTEDDDDDDESFATTIHHPANCRCFQSSSSPFSIVVSSVPINNNSATSAMIGKYDQPTFVLSLNDVQWNQYTEDTTTSTSINRHSTVAQYSVQSSTSHDATTPRDATADYKQYDDDVDGSWCMEAAARIMISVEVHGKLLMHLRDCCYQNPRKRTSSTQHYRRPNRRGAKKDKANHSNDHQSPSNDVTTTTSSPIPNGWMTHQQLLQRVPKLHRILIKTSVRYNAMCGSGDGSLLLLPNTDKTSHNHNSNGPHQQHQQQLLTNNHISPRHIHSVLQNVCGIRTMTTTTSGHRNSYYYAIDREWLLMHMNPKLGYNPLRGNIVLQLVEHRLLQLLDHCTNHNRSSNQQQRYCTNEICRVYESTFHEPLLFKPLGYMSFKDLIHAIPSVTRVYDNHATTGTKPTRRGGGTNENHWYIHRVERPPKYQQE